MTTAAPEGATPIDAATLQPAAIEGEARVVDESVEQADFDAGFGTAAQPTVTPAVETTEPAPAAPAEPAEPAAPAPKYVQITEEDFARLNEGVASVAGIKAALERQIGTAFGKMGGLERTLTQLQAATPAGQAVEFTDDMATELMEEFPEVGAVTVKAIKKFAEKLKGVGPAVAGPDAGQVEQLVQTRLVAAQAEELEDMHPDWRAVVGAQDSNNEYRQWLTKQPDDYQRKLNSTNSAGVIARSISKFNEFKAKPAAPTPPHSIRKDIVRDAVTPRGTGGTPPGRSDDDEFNDGFKSG